MLTDIAKNLLDRMPRETLQTRHLDSFPELLALLEESERHELARTEAGSLCLTLLVAFDAVPVHFLWECDADWETPVGPAAAGKDRLRLDPPHASVSAPHRREQPTLLAFELLPVDRGIHRLEGLLEARTKRNEEYWIVAALRTSAAEMPEYLQELTQRHPGLLIVQRQSLSTKTPEPPPSGWLDGNDLAGLGRLFQEIIQLGNSQYLRIQSPLDSAAHPPSGSTTPENLHEALLQQALRDLETERPTTAVIALDSLSPAWMKPAEVAREQQVRLERARGLIHGECRPVLVLEEATLRKHFDQLVQDFCQPGLPITLLLRQAPPDAEPSPVPTLGLLPLLPRTRVVVPRLVGELGPLLRQASGEPGPVVLWLPPRLETSSEPIRLDDVELIRRGRDIGLIASGPTVGLALAAAEILQAEGIDCAVLNLRCLQPLNLQRLTEHCRQTGHWIVVEPTIAEVGGSLWSLLLPQLRAARAACRLWRLESDKSVPNPAELVRFARATLTETTPFESPDFEVRQIDPSRELLHERFGFRTQAIRQELTAIENVELTPAIQQWHRLYQTIGRRKSYLWKWCFHGIELTTLPSVAPELRLYLNETKILSVILCVVYDDVADQDGNRGLLRRLLNIIRGNKRPVSRGKNAEQAGIPEIAWELWREYRARVATLPQLRKYEELLWFDLDQFFNMMRYSNLINRRLEWANPEEHDVYTPHNMMIMSFGVLDLMCSPEIPVEEQRFIRQGIYHAQQMGRIGNLISTWRRELSEKDFAGALFIRAVQKGDVTQDQLRTLPAEELEKQIRHQEHEQYFFTKWQSHLRQLQQLARNVQSMDLSGVIEGHQRFLGLHLGSQGLI